MSTTLVIAISFILAAFVFYSIGVWAERIKGRLKPWHAATFWVGFACDTTGTTAMGILAGGLFHETLHAITGIAAIVLMLVHAVWATITLLRKDERLILSFHKFSVFVWVVWLIPFLGGVILGTDV